jgi:hypothetical protein
MQSLPVSSSPCLSLRSRVATRRRMLTLLPAALPLALASLAPSAVAQTQSDPAKSVPPQPAATAQAQPTPEISAPVPVDQQTSEQAALANPFSDSNSSSAAGQQSAPAQSFTAPAHQNGPHHTLGKTMAIVGTIALGVGVTGYALADEHCKRYTGAICGGFHNGGIGLMAGGGALASVGFYWEFQKPKQ